MIDDFDNRTDNIIMGQKKKKKAKKMITKKMNMNIKSSLV